MTATTIDITVEKLAQRLLDAKAAEAKAASDRASIEQQIIERLGNKPEGAVTHQLISGLKITITGKMSYKADMDMLMQLAGPLPPNMRPIKMEPKLDETGAKYLRNNEPEIWAQLAPAITVKPVKTSVEIKA
jgi:predicted DNA-binding protein (UPF0251 family)